MTINQWITEARGRCERATYECLCGLPGCSQCLADFEYERRARRRGMSESKRETPKPEGRDDA